MAIRAFITTQKIFLEPFLLVKNGGKNLLNFFTTSYFPPKKKNLNTNQTSLDHPNYYRLSFKELSIIFHFTSFAMRFFCNASFFIYPFCFIANYDFHNM